MNNHVPSEARTLSSVSPTTMTAHKPATPEREPVLLSYWFIVLRRKFVIIPIVVAALAIGLVITLLTTPRFTATARIEISKTRTDLARIGETDQDGDKLSDLTFYQTQYGLLRARSLAERVARSLRLVDDRAFYDAFGLKRGTDSEVSGRAQPLTQPQREAELSKVVNVLLGNQAVSPVRDSSLVDVRFVSADPSVAAKVSNAWVQQFIQANMDQRFAATADARTFLERRLGQVRGRLEDSERNLVNYTASQQIVSLSSSVSADGKTRSERTLTGDELETFNRALSEAIADRIAAESRLGRGEAATTVGQQSGGRSTSVAALRQRRAEVAADYARMMVQFAPDYPPAAALKSQVDSLDRAIAGETSRISNNVAAEYQEASAREQRLRQAVDQLKQQLNVQQRRGIQANIYQRDVDTNRELYNSLLQRNKEIGVAGVGTNNVMIVDPAKIPQAPSSPNLILNMLVALMLGGIIAGATAFALEQIDETIKNPGDIARIINEPMLGAIPNNDKDSLLTLLDDPKSSTAEAYFSTLTSLRFATNHGIPRSLVVTSTRAAEGKSTSAAALARSIGRTGRSVVLIDGDMRSPSLHSFFNTDHERGLSDFLAGERDIETLLRPTDWSNVQLMTSGPRPPNTAELLSDTNMRDLISTLMTRFDHIVVDGPPLLGLADAPLISEVVEGVVFVVSASGPSTRLIRNALDRLHAANAHIFGIILTKFRIETSQYSYGYGYESTYGKDER
ncbi:polysaccharide biosynthesis tyrosine autokinase [Sphingomonas sp. CFBP 13714]|uniref:GumC family protein n=1 Tax=Sphingomonas TaxID=13687 RepID=UPI00141AA896|nr:MULTISPECIES: polysaccharide biosynthesis tyrosine autokinase [Sphingomonas]MBD8698311.1 polysaccharide biosynthesis tyrosine autokinase [Sphingomonas sp. CFBP 13714]NII57800.1 capsular exopolysaccharide synthesis family protein [Sphingomonas aerolata]